MWKSDGTANGTVMVKDIKSGGSSDDSNPGKMTAVGNKLFFRAVPTDENELWVSDGTENGTIMLTTPAPYSSCCGSLEAIGDTLFFTADDGTSNESEMWRSDGTAAGTVMAQDICSPYCGGLGGGYTAVGNTIFFLAHDNTGHGIEVWAYDPTNITFGELLTFTFDFKLQVLEQLYPIFPSEDSADLAIDEPMVNITFQHKILSLIHI